MASERETIAEIEAVLRDQIVLRRMGEHSFMEGFEEAARAIAAIRSKDREDGAREAIRWEKRDGGWWAYSAKLRVGFVVRRPAEGGGHEWAYEIAAVFTKWITKGQGATTSERTAKAAIERAWGAWLDHAGLAALPLQPTPKGDGDA